MHEEYRRREDEKATRREQAQAERSLGLFVSARLDPLTRHARLWAAEDRITEAAHSLVRRYELEEANRENRRIIAALTSRIPALETPENAPESPEPGAEMPVGPTPSEASEAAQEPSERISWWRRMLG
jgi:hypothetical protein